MRILKNQVLLAGLALAGLLLVFYGWILVSGYYIFTGTIQDITNIYGFFPWDTHTIRELARGHFPLWNPYNALGVPHLANMQSAPFYPLNQLKYILGFWASIDLALLIRLWLAGLFSYLLARRVMKVGFVPGLLAGSAFMLSGYLTRYVYMSHLNVEALLPLQLWLFHRLAERRTPGRFIAAGAGIFCLVAGGFPEAALYAVSIASVFYIFCGLYLFGANDSRARSLAVHVCLLFGVLSLGFILSLAQWLPFAEYLDQAWTYHQPGDGLRHLSPAYCISLVLPWFFGSNRLSTLVPFLAPGLGLVAVILAVRACLDMRKSAAIAFFSCLALVLAAVIYGIPPFSLIGHIFPFSLTYNDKYAQAGLALCAAMLAAKGLEMLAVESDHRKSLTAGLIVFMFVALNLVLALLDAFNPYFGFGAKSGIIQASAVLFGLGLLIVFYRRFNWPVMVLLSAVLGLSVLAMVSDFAGLKPRFETSFISDVNEAKKLAELSKDQYRFSAEDEIFFPDLLLAVEVADLRSYEPLYPKSYVEYMSVLNGLEGDAVRKHYDEHMLFQVNRDKVGSPLAALANLKLYAVHDEISSVSFINPLPSGSRDIGPFAGWSRVLLLPVMESPRRALMQHAPGLFRIPVSRISQLESLAFFTGVPVGEDAEGSLEREVRGHDGVSMLASFRNRDMKRLLYARHFSRKVRADEPAWSDHETPLPGLSAGYLDLAVLPGPENLLEADIAAWAGLRLKTEAESSRFDRLNPEDASPGYYQNMKAFPRAFFVKGFSMVPGADRQEKLAKISELIKKWPDVFPYQALLVREGYQEEEISKGLSDKTREDIKDRVAIIEYTPDMVKVACRSQKPGFVLLSDQYFPGWRAFRDGKEVRIYEADIALRIVPVEAGESVVVFRYEPWSFRIGLFAAIASALAGILVIAAMLLEDIVNHKITKDLN